MADVVNGISDASCDSIGGDCSSGVEDAGYRGGTWCRVLSEVEDSAYDGLDRANVGVSASGKPDDFASHAILLVGECEGGKTCLLDLLDWCRGEIDACFSDEELDVG